jgi:protein phosphatase
MRLLTTQCFLDDFERRFAIDAGARTRVGNRRSNNEDAYFVDPDERVFVIADGIGGASAGEMASQTAVDLLPRYVSSIIAQPRASEDQVTEALAAAFAKTSATILKIAQRTPHLHRMGTTAVMAVVVGPRVFVASIGDSRAYLIRAGQIEQLTVDHTAAQALVQAGVISREAAVHHQWRNVLCKFLGNGEPGNTPDVRVVDLQADDQLILATDGLYDAVEPQAMPAILSESSNAQLAADALIAAAAANKARDDATCVVLAAEEIADPAATEWWHTLSGRMSSEFK